MVLSIRINFPIRPEVLPTYPFKSGGGYPLFAA